ncbi:hypothetical protein ACWGDX_02935 [Streptomyces sp. NPDC055025]
MSAVLAQHPAAPAAGAPCPEPPRAAPGAPARASGGLRVRVPLRLVTGAQYTDAALPVYVKIAALAMRPAGCRARVDTIAAYLGMSTSAVERGLRQLHNADPVDGITEVLTVRKTLPDGTGESAERRVRAVDTDGPELYVWIPVRAAEALTPRELRLYAAITYAQIRRIPLALADLCDHVRHQSGVRAGEPLGERQVMRIVDGMEASGWVTVHRRQGPRGRHIYETHRHPLHAVPTGQTAHGPGPAGPDIHDGSAPRSTDGSPSEEDPRTDRPDDKDTEPSGGIRRRRGDRKWVTRPVENPERVPDTFRAGHPEKRSSGRVYDGPDLDLSKRVWTVLAPVHHEVENLSTWELRTIARRIGHQLDTGTEPERLTARLQARYASTKEPYRGTGGIGRWILGVSLDRKGCGLDSCEDGTTWHTGQRCFVCLDNSMDQADTRRREEADREERDRAQRRWAQRTAAWARRQEQERAAARPSPPADPDRWAPGPRTPRPDTTAPVLTRAQKTTLRTAATADEVRAAIRQHGAYVATDVYGHALVLPHLNSSEGDARAQY